MLSDIYENELRRAVAERKCTRQIFDGPCIHINQCFGP